MLGPEHVGRRVVVRMRLADASPGRRYRDVTGELIEIDADRLRVVPPAGTVVTVDAADVVAARPVPPKPTPFSEILELERRLAASWPAVETEDFGGWLLRYSEGFSRRANSVLAPTEPDAGLEEAIGRVERWYGARGARPLVSVALPVARRLDRALAQRGWTAEAETAVLTKPVEAGDASPEVAISHEPGPELLEQLGRGKPRAAAAVLGSGPTRAFAEIRRDGVLAARGRAAIEGDVAAVSGIGTLPRYRRRGLGGEVLRALEAWAASAGAHRVALQVEADNDAALSVYGRQGFQERYRYWYRGPA
ncbi:GNAT family N-acetyltransferase [Glycomyces xiaoerkulensis]|uniref:GNAT family N-acetyltransferase n=1 Tax=Glycomyces xiaoerkulensis TaxID=2038139 RepID=UPI0012FFE6C0|nr:GNAT family N-acetyltransferase [Glycomyces xiaoerkulensis]